MPALNDQPKQTYTKFVRKQRAEQKLLEAQRERLLTGLLFVDDVPTIRIEDRVCGCQYWRSGVDGRYYRTQKCCNYPKCGGKRFEILQGKNFSPNEKNDISLTSLCVRGSPMQDV